jgi:CheY-like chemotaxis protein
MFTTLQDTSILVVDDDPDTCQLLRISLEQAGAAVVTVQSVDAAVSAFRHSPPHLIVSDIRLQSSDGFELMKAIREHNKEYRGYTPAIALSGFSSPGDKERALSTGFNVYLVKPVNPEDIVSAAVKLLREARNPAA